MKARLTVLVFVLLSLIPYRTHAQGTPQPPFAGQSIYLAKFAPQSVAVSNGATITVPVGVLPFVSWSTASGCAQPTNAVLHLQLLTVESGITNILSAPDAVLAAPRIPGPQAFSGPVQFIIPPGLVSTSSLPMFTTVQGTYTVNFGAGFGNSTLTASGDVAVAMVEIPVSIVALNSQDIDRLGMRSLGDLISKTPIPTARQGDQVNHFFQINNNDPSNSVDLTIDVSVRQTAGLPLGFTALGAYTGGVYSLANPVPGTEALACAFGSSTSIGTLLDQIDRTEVVTSPKTTSLSIPARGSGVISVILRGHGANALGSCNEIALRATGSFFNGDPAKGAASSLYLVGDVPARTPGIEITDLIKVSPSKEALMTPMYFYNNSTWLTGLTTFAAGNLPPSNGAFQVGYNLVGSGLSQFNTSKYPSTAIDRIRLPSNFNTMIYGGYYFPNAPLETPWVYNMWQINNANYLGSKPFSYPYILPNPARPSNVWFDVTYDAFSHDITVKEGTQTHFFGDYTDFLKKPLLRPTLSLDLGTSRTITRTGSLDYPLFMDARPLGYALNLSNGSGASTSNFQVAFSPFDVNATWSAKYKGFNSRLLTKKGFFDDPLMIGILPFSGDPFRSRATLTITSKNAANGVPMPVVITW